MKLNEQKLLQQKQILQTWLDQKARGTVVAPTGFGKSFIAVLIIRKMNESHPERTTIIVVPTIALKSQWEMQVFEHNLSGVQVIVINTITLHTYKCHLLILDEIHRYAAPMFRKVFDNVQFNFLLGLTATIKRTDKKHYLLEAYCPVIFDMKLSEAKQRKFVSGFTIYNLPVEMNAAEKILFDGVERLFHYYFAWFNHDFHRAMLCCTNKAYCASLAHDMNLPVADVRVKAINFARYLQKRKACVYNVHSKLTAIRELLQLFPDQKVIVFSETCEFADEVTQMVGPTSVSLHTKIPLKQRRQNFHDFTREDSPLRIISTAKMYDEGVDIPSASFAIIASGSSSQRQFTQRLGRVIRFVEGKESVIVNLYTRGTQEEGWVRERTAGNNAIWVENVQQIIERVKGEPQLIFH